MYALISDFLLLCIEVGKIPLDYVKSSEFIGLLEKSGVTKEPCYEELCYCRNKELQIALDRSEARYFDVKSGLFMADSLESPRMNAKINVDLSSGHKKFRVLSRTSLTLDNVRGTKYVAMEEFERNENKKLDENIVTSRHTLLDLLHLPFQKSSIIQNIVAFNGQVFMEAEQRPQKRADASSMTGYNFEEVMTCAEFEINNSKTFEFIPPINNAVKYNSMINHTFPETGLSILVSCEIDSIKRRLEEVAALYNETEFKYKILENNIEMKSRKIGSRNNLIKAILQCYLAGTNELVIGYRDDNFNLKYVEKLNVSELLETSNNPLLNRAFLDKWFWFIAEFISKAVKMPRSLALHHHQLTFSKNNNLIILKSFRLSPYRLEKTIISRFVKWRRYLATMQKNQLLVEDNVGVINNRNKKGKTQSKKKDKKSEDTNFSTKITDHNDSVSKFEDKEQNETDHITKVLEHVSLS